MSSIRRASRSSVGSRRSLIVGILLTAALFFLVMQVVRPYDSDELQSIQELSNAFSLLANKAGTSTAGSSREMSSLRSLSKSAATSVASPYSNIEITCDAVQELLDNKSWFDPNEGDYLIRRTRLVNEHEPVFFVSVHKKEYDPLRYNTIYERGRYYELKVIRRFNTILKQYPPASNSIIVDVGGNIGYYSLLSAAHKHQVVSFEINPANIIRFCESASLNRFTDRIHIVQRGVSDAADKPLLVYVPPHNPGEAQMVEPGQTTVRSPGTGKIIDITNHTSQASLARTVTVTLDQFAQQHGWFDTPGFIIPILKMDIEGHESSVIDGARKLLSSGIVKNILTEFRYIEKSPQKEAIQLLLEAGYVAVDHPKVALEKYTRDTTWAYLLEQDARFLRTRQNTDLWFQLESAELAPILLT